MFQTWAGSNRNFGKLFMYRDTAFSDGTARHWVNISENFPDGTDYYQIFDFDFAGDDTVFVSFIKYVSPIASGVSADYAGIMRGVYTDSSSIDMEDRWTWTDISNSGATDGLPDSASRITEVLVNPLGDGRLFVTSSRPNGGVSGGVYLLEDLTDDSWTRVYHDDSNSGMRDMQSLAQSPDGTKVYAGARGRSVGAGGVVMCSDPANADSSGTWSVLGDLDSFDFESPPPFWQEDTSWINNKANYRMANVQSIAVVPNSGGKIIAGLMATGFARAEGIWYWTGSAWQASSWWEDYAGVGIHCLTYSPVTEGQLFVGTNGGGLLYNGVLPTSKSLVVVDDGRQANERTILGLKRSGATSIRLAIGRSARTRVAVYDIRGRLVQRIDMGMLQAGEHEITWNGSDEGGRRSAAGVYLMRIQSGADFGTSKLLLVR